jgi:hypothetical protein
MRKIKRHKWSDLTPGEQIVFNSVVKSILLRDIKNHKIEVPPKDLKLLKERSRLKDLFHIKFK